MTGVYLNDSEQAVLDQLDYIYEALYRRGIRRYMDFKTGIVGIKRGISWQSLKEELSIKPRKGISPKNISKEQVRRLAKYLEKVGLVKIKSTSKRLVFECILALSHRSVQNKPDTIPDTFYHKKYQKADRSNVYKNTMKSISSSDLKEIPDTLNLYLEPKPDTIPDTPLYKDIYISTNVDILSDFEIKKVFEECFWKPYPQGHRVKKKQSYEKYKRKKYYLSPMKETIMNDIALRKEKHRSWIDGFVPHPTTYLNGERWNDEIQSKENLNGNNRKINGSKGASIARVLESCFESSTIDEPNKANFAKVG